MAVPFRVLGARSTAIDTVEVRFNHDVNPSLTGDNFTIAQAYGMGPLSITSVSIKYNEPSVVVLKTYTQIPFMFYKITMTGVRSLHTNEIVDTDYSSNTVVFDGYSERDTILDRMVNSLSPIIANSTKVQSNAVEVETNVSKFFRGVADEIKRLYKEIGNVAMDNYLSLTVSDEKMIRGKGNYDKFGKYGAFEISRVSKDPSSTAKTYSETVQIYFDGDTQLITQSVVGYLQDVAATTDQYGESHCNIQVRTVDNAPYVDTVLLRYDAPELINAGRFLRPGTEDKCITVFDAEEALITSTPYVIKVQRGPVLKVLFVLNATQGIAYPLSSYALKNNFYDANNAFIDTRLTENEFKLNPAVGGFAPPAAGDRILVVYTYNNSTRRIIPDSVVVTAKVAIPTSRTPEPLPANMYIEFPASDLATAAEPSFGPSNLELARLQGLVYKLANVNTLDNAANAPAQANNTSLAIFVAGKKMNADTMAQDVYVKRVDGTPEWYQIPDDTSGATYNINPFVSEIPWTPSSSGRLKWGQYMVNYTSSESLVPETQIEYGQPNLDEAGTPPAEVIQQRVVSVPPAIYTSYLYLAQYQEGLDYSLILDTQNIYTIDPLLIGAIVPINSTSSRLQTGQTVAVTYEYENVFVQGKDYSLFANVEECYERVENRVNVDADGNVSINTLYYPLEEVNSVFSEGTGVQYPVLRMHDNHVDIQGTVNIKDASEILEFKTVQETVDILTTGNTASLSNALLLNADHTTLGGDIYSVANDQRIKVDKLGIRTAYLAGTDAKMQMFASNLYAEGADANRFAGIDFNSVYNPFAITPDTVGDVYYSSYEDINVFDVVNCQNVTNPTVPSQINNISLIPECFKGMIDSSVVFEPTICVYDGGGFCMLTKGKQINADNASRPSDSKIDDEHLAMLAINTVTFSGAGLDDLTISRPLDQTHAVLFRVKISSASTTDKFVWSYSEDYGYTYSDWSAEVEIDGTWQTLTTQLVEILIMFGATTGHTLNDSWSFTNFASYSTSGKTSPNNLDTPELCTDTTNKDPNLYNLHAPCKSFSCCRYTSIFAKEVPFIDGKTEFYRYYMDAANRPILDSTGFPVLVRREPYGTYSVDYVTGTLHTSLDPSSVAANTQKQVTVSYATAAADVKNPYITKVDSVTKQRVSVALSSNAQVSDLDKMRIDHYEVGTIYFSDICRFDGSAMIDPPGSINSISVLDGGAGYTSAPKVNILGGTLQTNGVAATAHAVIDGGVVVKIIMDNVGSGYTTKPTVVVDAPGELSQNPTWRQAKAIPNFSLVGLRAARCTNYPYALSNPMDQFQGAYTPTGCIYDQSTTGYSVCAKMDGVIEALGDSPREADPDYIYRLSSTSKIHGICMETSCRFYTASGKQKDYAGNNGRGLYYSNCRNSMCPNYQPVYLGSNEQMLAAYSYVADSLVIDYVYGDNGIDWSMNLNALQPSGTRYIGVEDDGEPYYVTYKIGAREPALYNNFAYALGTPLLDAASRRWAKEMYRKAIIGVISAYLSGPTFHGVDSLVETFTETPPEIMEGTTFGWILGENYIYIKPESLSGQAFYTRATATTAVDPFGVGLWMRGDNVLRYDGQANFRIASGSLDMFVAPEWSLKNKQVIVDLYQNNSQALRGEAIINDASPPTGYSNGITYDPDSGLALINDIGELEYEIDAGAVVSWKSLVIDTSLVPAFIDETRKISITAYVRVWNNAGEDGYTSQVDEYGQPYCGIAGTAYTDNYAPEWNAEFTTVFDTVVGTAGYTCPTLSTLACAAPCSGEECLDPQCDCLSGCHNTLFFDKDTAVATSAENYVGRYLTFLTGNDAGRTYVINDISIQYVPQAAVKDMHTLYAHTNPQLGDSYIVPSEVPQFTPSGFANIWWGHENEIALWNGRTWVFVVPTVGRSMWVEDVQYQFIWDGNRWHAASLDEVAVPNERGYTERKGFVLTNYMSTIKESGIAYRIHSSPQIMYTISSLPTARYMRVLLRFELDKVACDPYGSGYNYGVYPPAATIDQSTITIPGHAFATGQEIIYYNGPSESGGLVIDNCTAVTPEYLSGGSVIGGLVNTGTYYVIAVDADTVALAATKADALAGTFIGFTSSGSPMHFLRAVNAVALQSPDSYDWPTGTPVVFAVEPGSSPIAGVTDGQTYYIIRLNARTFQLASTSQNALDGVALDLFPTTTGYGAYSVTYNSETHAFALSDLNFTYSFLPDAITIHTTSLVHMTCGTQLGISNIEVFYTNPICAFESPVISTLFDIRDDKSDMYSNRMSIFRDQNNLLHFRVYEDKAAAQKHLVSVPTNALATTFPKTGDCRSYYEVVVDLDRVYGPTANPPGDTCKALTANVGSDEWTTRRRHYFGFTWKLNDGSVTCSDKNSNLHVFVDGNEYPKPADQAVEAGTFLDYNADNCIGWVNHGILCPDGTLYEIKTVEPKSGLQSKLQVDKFTQRKSFDSLSLCEKPINAALKIYLEGWTEDTTQQWAAMGKSNDVPLPINIDYTGNILRLQSGDNSTLWPCSYYTSNTTPSAADNAGESRMPAGIYISDPYDALVPNKIHWNQVRLLVSSSTLQRKLFSRGFKTCDGTVIDACHSDECSPQPINPDYPDIDVGVGTDSVNKALRVFYRASEFANFIESGVEVGWTAVDYTVETSNYEYGGVIPPCTDKLTCVADVDANGRYLQYRLEFFSDGEPDGSTDGSFTALVYSVEFLCDKIAIDSYVVPTLQGTNLFIKPLNIVTVN